jgi:hypothetical protein
MSNGVREGFAIVVSCSTIKRGSGNALVRELAGT